MGSTSDSGWPSLLSHFFGLFKGSCFWTPFWSTFWTKKAMVQNHHIYPNLGGRIRWITTQCRPNYTVLTDPEQRWSKRGSKNDPKKRQPLNVYIYPPKKSQIDFLTKIGFWPKTEHFFETSLGLYKQKWPKNPKKSEKKGPFFDPFFKNFRSKTSKIVSV